MYSSIYKCYIIYIHSSLLELPGAGFGTIQHAFHKQCSKGKQEKKRRLRKADRTALQNALLLPCSHAVCATRKTACERFHGTPQLFMASCRIVPCCAVPYSTVSSRTVPYRTEPYGIVLCRSVPYRTLLYCTVPYRLLPYCTVPYRPLPYCTVPSFTVLYRTVPYRTAPYRTVPYRALQHLACLLLYLLQSAAHSSIF